MTDASFLAPPDEIFDWRRIVVTSTAARAGILTGLPGTASDIASELGHDPHTTRVLLDALAVWDVVEHRDELYVAGSQFPSGSETLVLDQHAQFMQRWGEQLDDRLADRLIEKHPPRPTGALASWLGGIGAGAEKQAPAIVDRCLGYFPHTTSVLDVAGGHGEYGMEFARRGSDVTMLDVPDVIDVVSKWEPLAASGIQLFAGDVYNSRPAVTFDLVLCFGFSHTQPPERLGELFMQLADSTAPGGGIAIHTFIRGQGPVPAIFAVQMLLTGRGGDTHRLEDYTRWLTEAGFEPPQVEDLGDRSLLLARRQ